MMARATGHPRVVFDCNVLLQSLASERGSAARAMRRFEAGEFDLFFSTETLSELRDVLQSEEVQAISPSLTPERIREFLRWLAFRGVLRRRVRRLFRFARDPKDEPYLNLAAAAHADYLVTRDHDLLSLKTGRSLFCKQYRRATRPLRVVTPEEFLTAISAGEARGVR